MITHLPTRRVTGLKIEHIKQSANGPVIGSNLTYKIDGKNNSARVPWVATDPDAEMRRIEEALKKQSGRGPKDPAA